MTAYFVTAGAIALLVFVAVSLEWSKGLTRWEAVKEVATTAAASLVVGLLWPLILLLAIGIRLWDAA